MLKLSGMIKAFMSALFCFFLLFGFYQFAGHIIRQGELGPKTVEKYFQDIDGRSTYVNLYGGFQRLLGKRQVEGFTIFKNSYDKLVSPRNRLSELDVEGKVSEVQPVWDHLRLTRTPFLYIESPLPIADEEDLPYGVVDYSHQNATLTHKYLAGIPTLDLAELTKIPKQTRFYRTDHHWSGDTIFETYRFIVDWMISQKSLSVGHTVKHVQFKRVTVPDFLGSYGVKVGKLYDGEDAFIYYLPSIPCHLTCLTMTADGELIAEHTGGWYDALMDSSKLDDPDYYNKYYASLWGNGGENRVINHDIEDGKLLLIAHSYGRPLAQYLALNFHEVRQIDPQEGRFNGNYISYIDEYDPDVVLFLIEFEGEIIGEYGTAN